MMQKKVRTQPQLNVNLLSEGSHWIYSPWINMKQYNYETGYFQVIFDIY